MKHKHDMIKICLLEFSHTFPDRRDAHKLADKKDRND